MKRAIEIGAAAALLLGLTAGGLAVYGPLLVPKAPVATETAAPVESRSFVAEPVHPETIAPAPVVAAPVEPAPVQEAPAPPAATVDSNGGVTGSGCPAPYVDNGYGCQSPICSVDENGNNVPCQ